MRGWTGGGGGGGRGGDKGDGGREGGENFVGGGYTKICILPILLYFYILQCNNWVSKVSNGRIKVNSGIFTMKPVLISLHRRGVFRQPWFTVNSFTSDFGLSLVDYFPFIPKVHFIAVVGGNPHF